ncbi:MAG: ATP-binding protein [Myxococcota bacterium]|nr:ATP-binding protein [Myxococcota bacterium]
MLSSPKQSFFLFGPRGTGKTTWVRHQLKDAIYIDLLDASHFTALSAYPNRLEDLVPANYEGHVVIDEIQRIPQLLNEVHRLIASRRLYFCLTGSSVRSLRKKGTNLLAGRALTRHMFPLTAAELGQDFELSKAHVSGLLPMAVVGDNAGDFLKSYVQTYLREEVLQEGLTRNIGAFTRFLEAASFSQGQVLNISQVARDCGVERKVVENYFGILDDLLIGHRLPAFQKKARRRLVSHPKFYFFDAGIFRAIRPKGPLDRPEEIDGAALETLVYQELRAAVSYFDTGHDLYFWRTAAQEEVDFVLYGPRGILAIEIKRTNVLRRRDFRGLAAFKKDYPMARAIMLYGGNRVMSQDRTIEVIPLISFLSELPQYLA